MASKKITFKKKIISNKKANEEMLRGFEELSKSKVPVNEPLIIGFYNDVFYDMPIRGTNSHSNVVEMVDNYINRRYYNKLKNIIKRYTDDLAELDNKILLLENPSLDADPVLEDGAFLMVGDGGIQHQSMDDIYIMQEGRRRRFASWDIYITTRRALGLPEDTSGIYYVTVDEINRLKDGPDITDGTDLLLSGKALKVDIPDILGMSAYTELILACKGNEISDYMGGYMGTGDLSWNTNTEDYWDESFLDNANSSYYEDIQTNYDALQQIQFYLNEESCTAHSIVDDFYNDDVGPVVETIQIPAESEVTIKILRDSSFSNNNLPMNMNDFYDEYPNNNITYNGNDVSNYIQEWGPIGKYPSVVGAEGRLTYVEKYNAYLHGPVPNGLGIPSPTLTPLVFNGLPTGNTGEWSINPDIGLIDYDGYTGQELSVFGTKMLYKRSGLFGSLGQESGLQNYFDSPYNWYYRRHVWSSTVDRYVPIYGQPVVRYDNEYWVVLYPYKAYNGGNRWHFYNIKNGDVERYRKGQIEDWLGGDFNGGGVYWNDLSNSRIKFPGLRGWKPNGHSSNDNPFNLSSNGSNYG